MKFIDLKVDGDIATVMLDHPEGNRINFQMREELLGALENVAASEARVLLVKGKGQDFCLGGDIRDWPGDPATELRPRVEVFARAIDLLERLPIPTVAVVQGNCMGGGFELALGCDMILATQSARFVFPEAMLGIMTLQGGVYQLAERIGRNKAIELVFLSEPISATVLADWNVVNQIFDDSALNAGSKALAMRLANGPADAYARTKTLMSIWRHRGCSEARQSLYDISMPLFDTTDVQSALSAAAEAANAGLPFPRVSFRCDR
jgi:enoyl-CoA hydratase/carnithine racemase